MFNFTNSTQPLYLLGLEHGAAAVDGERGHLAVGIDLQILGRFVLARVHIDELQPVRRARLLQRYEPPARRCPDPIERVYVCFLPRMRSPPSRFSRLAAARMLV
jgi:hypothetical protein